MVIRGASEPLVLSIYRLDWWLIETGGFAASCSGRLWPFYIKSQLECRLLFVLSFGLLEAFFVCFLWFVGCVLVFCFVVFVF